jgi:hypothetical protein
MVIVNKELYRHVRGFLHTMAATCRECLRPKSACDECDLRDCRMLERELGQLEVPMNKRKLRMFPPSFAERSDLYLRCVQRAPERGLTSRQIDAGSHHCSRSLKHWTLQRMVELGLLKTYCNGRRTYYKLPNKGKHT